MESICLIFDFLLKESFLEIFDLIFYIYLFCMFECFEGMYVCTP